MINSIVCVDGDGIKRFYVDLYIKYAADCVLKSTQMTTELFLGNIKYGEEDFVFEYDGNDIEFIHKVKLCFYAKTNRKRFDYNYNYIEHKNYFVNIEEIWVDVGFLTCNLGVFDIRNNSLFRYEFKVNVITALKNKYSNLLIPTGYLGFSNYNIQVNLSKYTSKPIYISNWNDLKRYRNWNLIYNSEIKIDIPCLNDMDLNDLVYLYENNNKTVYIKYNPYRFRDENKGIQYLYDLLKLLKNKKKGNNRFEMVIGFQGASAKGIVITENIITLIIGFYKYFDKVTFLNLSYFK